MKPIVFFTDPGKDGDDLIATIHVILQAKAAGILAHDAPVKLVTTDEIPCDEYGNQHPEGKYGLRALYLSMHLSKIQKQLGLPLSSLPEVIPGPITSYYQYDEEKKRYYHQPSGSEAFYPVEEINEYYTRQPGDKRCLLSEQSNDWINKVKASTIEGASLISIAAFQGVADFLGALSEEERRKFTVTSMGYNKPYTDEDYQSRTANPHRLPYNARITDPEKAATAITALTKQNSFHVVSGTTRALPKYDGSGSWSANFTEIMARSYPLYAQAYSPLLLSGIVNFIKHSKYKGFWPHDAVPALMILLEQGNWSKLRLSELKKEMLFTAVKNVNASNLHLRMIEKTGVLIDSSVPGEENDLAVGNEMQSFVYGEELDVIFFTALLQVLAIEALPVAQKANSLLLPHYKNILIIKEELFKLRQNPQANSARIEGLERGIKSTWAMLGLMELQQQLALKSQDNLEPEALFIFGSEAEGFTLANLTENQAQSLNELVTLLIDWAQKGKNKYLLDESFLKLIRGMAELMLATGVELTVSEKVRDVFEAPKPSLIFSQFFNDMRNALLPTRRVKSFLQQQFGMEFKRTGNSLLYASIALHGNLEIPFPIGISGMSEQYQDRLCLSNQPPENRQAFLWHLAIHDAGKGDLIKKSVRKNTQGMYIIYLDDNYHQFNPENNVVTSTSKEDYEQANSEVDHDTALVIYSATGSSLHHCTRTEYLLWGEPAPATIDKKAIKICDELILLCNEVNIAQIIQGEIPFAGVKKGLDLFFEAYKQNPQKAGLVFVHHCYDIFGAAPLDSIVSITAGKSPELHLKINLLYETLLEVARQPLDENSSRIAYDRYRQKLAQATPEILNATEKENEVLAKTRLAQMLRCHLFKTKQSENQLLIAEDGYYEERTHAFVEIINTSLQSLETNEQTNLIHHLNRSGEENAAVMVMYGPKLLLTATAGSEFASVDLNDKAKITECLAPMLRLYNKLYGLQLQQGANYSVIDVNNLALIIEKLFSWYQKAEQQQKQTFADLLFMLQEKGLAKGFLEKLGNTIPVQLAQMKAALPAELPFAVTEEGQLIKADEIIEEEIKLAESQPTSPVETIIEDIKPNVVDEESKVIANVPSKQREKAVIQESQIQSSPECSLVETIIEAINKASTKADKQQALIAQVKLNQEKLSLEDMVDLYAQIKSIKELNEHQNPLRDRFFGIHNTNSWSETLRQFRAVAFNILKREVQGQSGNERIRTLDEAKKLLLIYEHTNNSFFAGAWGKTTTIRLINKLIKEEKKCNPQLTP
ncbi:MULTISPECIES: hypothetical protein [unclassified Legionella]|uniref:hypothetical protein n=1 Tax=unclassified Legionella TaxID=2622702 RepID=UPI0010541B03|nr:MULTISPECIES: hypothetical protein [unclassified Legionella]MDI9817898.1 hypothetical protein [Legionella sp. PL877]